MTVLSLYWKSPYLERLLKVINDLLFAAGKFKEAWKNCIHCHIVNKF